MGKVNKKQKQMEKLVDEKAKLAKREQMLAEIKAFSMAPAAAKLLKSVVTSNSKSQRKSALGKPRS
jgi:hypothetical protein